MKQISAKRFLVRSLFDGERISQLQLVDLTGPLLRVTRFETETAATVFIDARVVLIDIGRHPADLEERLSRLAAGDFNGAGLSEFIARTGHTPSDSVEAIAY